MARLFAASLFAPSLFAASLFDQGAVVPDLTVASVAVSPLVLSLGVGGVTGTLTATPKNAAGTTLGNPVTWASSNAAVATVSSTGVVTPIGGGSCSVTATSGGVSSLPVPVAVAKPYKGVTFSVSR